MGKNSKVEECYPHMSGEKRHHKDAEDRDLASRRQREKLPRDHQFSLDAQDRGARTLPQMAKDGIPAWVLTASSSAAQAGRFIWGRDPKKQEKGWEGKGERRRANLRISPAGNQSLNLGPHREM